MGEGEGIVWGLFHIFPFKKGSEEDFLGSRLAKRPWEINYKKVKRSSGNPFAEKTFGEMKFTQFPLAPE